MSLYAPDGSPWLYSPSVSSEYLPLLNQPANVLKSGDDAFPSRSLQIPNENANCPIHASSGGPYTCGQLHAAHEWSLKEISTLEAEVNRLRVLIIQLSMARSESTPDEAAGLETEGGQMVTAGHPIHNQDTPLPPLANSNFPNVLNWTRAAHKAIKSEKMDITTLSSDGSTPAGVTHRGASRAAKDINVLMTYVVGTDGIPVSGHVATDMRKCARGIWQYIVNVSGFVPKTWGSIPLPMKQVFYTRLDRAFVEFRLCSGHWKADQLAIDYYPSWAGYRGKRKGKRSSESIDNDSDDPSPPSPPGPSPKRHKTPDSASPAPSSSLTPVETAAAAPPAADPPTADPAAAAITDSIGATVTDSAGAGATEPASTPEAGATNGVQTEPPAISVETVIPPSHAPVAIANPLDEVDFGSVPNSTSIATLNTLPAASTAVTTPATPTPTSSITSAAQVAASTSTRAKRSPRLYTPGKRDTAKNICGREWKLANPAGTEREFDTYWKAPENSDAREQFTNKENELTAAKKAMRATRVRAGAA